MLKLIIGFILLAAAAFWLLNKGGGDLDMGGEKHGAEAQHMADSAKPASGAATAASAPMADAASGAAPAAASGASTAK
jgi:hypothetical protein